MDRVSVPLWGATLSGPLPVFVLVGRYPHQLTDGPQAPPKVAIRFYLSLSNYDKLIRFCHPFPGDIPIFGAGHQRVTHPFATNALLHPFDLHVLGTPPAFILSQDQTLR